jgi:hypothetical protein
MAQGVVIEQRKAFDGPACRGPKYSATLNQRILESRFPGAEFNVERVVGPGELARDTPRVALSLPPRSPRRERRGGPASRAGGEACQRLRGDSDTGPDRFHGRMPVHPTRCADRHDHHPVRPGRLADPAPKTRKGCGRLSGRSSWRGHFPETLAHAGSAIVGSARNVTSPDRTDLQDTGE